MGSPTKSILLTPGTAAARRKTVSFGDAVANDEQKKPARGGNEDKPQQRAGSITSQWNSGRPSPTKKPRSKLTQSLLDAREAKSSEKEDLLVPVPKKDEPKVGPSKTTSETWNDGPITDDGDETINLNEPRSQSGQYWKSEFENYRAKTDREIRKLIQYRSVAKSYARKKDLEALRLAEKLKAEEAKVTEVERKVSELASGMVEGTEGETGREEVVKDLVNQTTLALQYKQKANALRKTLERHGVIINDDELERDEDKPPGEASSSEQVHHQANTQPNATGDQKSDMEELRQLVHNSEKKAADLEKENITLKKNILRVKGEMGKYEERRKSREASLKQREQKLENRNQEYRERLSLASKERRDAESALKRSFDDEKKEMVVQIESLQSQLAAAGKLPSVSKSEKERPEKSSRDQLSGTSRNEFVHPSRRRLEQKQSAEHEMLDGSGKGSQSNRHTAESHQQPEPGLKPKRSHDSSKDVDIWATQVDSTSKNHDVANPRPSAAKLGKEEVADTSARRASHTHSYRLSTIPDHDHTDIPPSSPPQLPSPEASLIEFTPAKAEEKPTHQHYQPKVHAFQSPRPSMVPVQPAPTKYSEDTGIQQSRNLHVQQHPQARISKRPSAVALDRDARHTPTTSKPDHSRLSSSRKDNSAIARRAAIPADRLAAASARLKAMPKENRKSDTGARGVPISGGKENTHPAYREI